MGEHRFAAQALSGREQSGAGASMVDQPAQADRLIAEKGISTANQAQEMVNNIDNYQSTRTSDGFIRPEQKHLDY
ncbi:MAG: hypothetical protein ACRD10_00250 [Terriglobia bacterium]